MFNTFLTDDHDQNKNMGCFGGPIYETALNQNLLYVGGSFNGLIGYQPSLLLLDNSGLSGIQAVESPIDFTLDHYQHGNGVSFRDIIKLDDGSYACSMNQLRSNNHFYISNPKVGTPLLVNTRLRRGHLINLTPSGLNTGWAMAQGGGKQTNTLLMLNSRTGFICYNGNNMSSLLPPNTSQNPGSRTVNKVVLGRNTSRNTMGYYLDQSDSNITVFNSARTVFNQPKEPFFITGSIFPGTTNNLGAGTGIVMYNQTFTTNDSLTLGGISAHDIISGIARTGLTSCNGSVTHAKLDTERNRIYFVGNFTTVNGVTRNRAAACDLNFNLLPWNPNLAASIFANMELGKSGVYICGGTNIMNPQGSGANYSYLAKFDYENGNLIPEFRPAASLQNLAQYGTDTVREFGDGKYLLVHTPTIAINNNPNYGRVSVDPSLSGRTMIGSPLIIDTISGQYVYGALDFYKSSPIGAGLNAIKRIIDNKLVVPHTGPGTSIYGTFKERTSAACIDLNTNSLTNWNPSIAMQNANVNIVNAMYVDTGSNVIFLGGTFDYINNAVRTRIGGVDLISGKTNHPFSPSFWGDIVSNDISISAIEKSGNILYLGGCFRRPSDNTTQAFAGFNTGTSAYVEGIGWNIQDFPNPINKNGYGREYLSRTLVQAMKRRNNLLYVGGRFSQVSGLSRSGLFCYDIARKQITDLNIPFDDVVYDLDIDQDNNILYAVGRFHTVNGLPRPRGAAINLNTSGVTDWNPAFSRHPLQVKVHPSGILVAGTFADLGTGKAYSLTVFDYNNGEMQRYPRSTTVHDLYCMDIYSGRLYVGGSTWVQNDTLALDRCVIGYDLNNGRLYTGWAPNPNNTALAMHIKQDSGILYLGGVFQNVRSNPPPSTTTTTRNRIAAWDIKTQPHTFVTSFDPNLNSTCNVITSSGNMLYFGGSFTTVGATTRNRIAAWNLSTNTLDTNFNPNVGNNSVLSMKISGDHMYIGGDFTLVGGQTRNRCAKVRLSDGALDTNFNPNLNSTVRAIDISGEYIYLGGNFSSVNSTNTKIRMCAVNASNGLVYNNFVPIPNFTVSKMYYNDPSTYNLINFTQQSYDYVEDIKVYPGTGVGFCGYHWELNQNSGNRGVHFVDPTGGQLIKTFGGFGGSVWQGFDVVGGGQSVYGRAGEEFMINDNKLYVINRGARGSYYENMNRLDHKNAYLTITDKITGNPITEKNFAVNMDFESFFGNGFGGGTQWMRQYVHGVNYSGDNVFFYGEFVNLYPDDRISIGKMGVDGKLKNDFKLFSL